MYLEKALEKDKSANNPLRYHLVIIVNLSGSLAGDLANAFEIKGRNTREVCF